jgi:hypothetical protein
MKNFNFFKLLAIATFVFAAAFSSFAETFYLSTGEKIEGTITDASDDYVVITPEPIKILKSDVFSSRKERFNAENNWNRHLFELSGGLGVSHCYDHGGDGFGFVIGGHVTAGFTYNYSITKYFALGHGVRFKVDIVNASNGYNDELRPKQTEYSSNVEYDFDDVEDRRWNVNGGFTFSIVDQFMFGSIKNKQLAAVIDLLYGRTVGGGLGIYYRGFVWKFIYSFDIPVGGTMPLHSFSLNFGYKIGAGKKKTSL